MMKVYWLYITIKFTFFNSLTHKQSNDIIKHSIQMMNNTIIDITIHYSFNK